MESPRSETYSLGWIREMASASGLELTDNRCAAVAVLVRSWFPDARELSKFVSQMEELEPFVVGASKEGS